MCMKCLLLEALAMNAAREEALREDEQQQPTDKSSAMGTAPSQPELSQSEQEYEQIELDKARAEVNVTNAEAVRKLAHAAQILEGINQSAAVKRIMDLIDELVPAQPDPGPAPEAPEPAEDDGVPPEIAELAKQLAEELGISIEVLRFPRK